ncbi:MAG: hypothetical protein ACXVRK_14815 [Gaiellaceae bacterium]
MGDREKRRGQNEALFREVNERIAEAGERLDGDHLEIFCECADIACAAQIELPRRAYEEARQKAATFVVVPNHVDSSVERVVSGRGGYVLVEKLGDAAEVAVQTDPR